MKEILYKELYEKKSAYLDIPEDINKHEIIEACTLSIKKQIIDACKILEEDISIKDISLQYVYWSAEYNFSYSVDKDTEFNNAGYLEPDTSTTTVNNMQEFDAILDEYHANESAKEGTLESLYAVLEKYHPKDYNNKPITFRSYEQKVLRNTTCFTCNGKKKVLCITCDGEGKVACTNCKNGSIKCNSCSGSGKKSCSNCYGGEVTCISCGGSGKLGTREGYNGNIEVIRCSSCRNGKKTCSTCGGSAKIKCSKCSGRGTLTCPICNGTSFIGCRTCSGSGQLDCKTCKATGSLHDIGYVNTNYTATENQLLDFEITDKYPFNIEHHRAYYEHVSSHVNEDNTITKCFINRMPLFEVTILSNYDNKEYKTFVHGNDFIIHESEEVFNIFSATKTMRMKEEISSISLFSLSFKSKIEEQLKTYITTPKLIRAIHKNIKDMTEEEKVFYKMIKSLVEKYSWYHFIKSLIAFFPILALASMGLFSVLIVSQFTPIKVANFKDLNSISIFLFIEVFSFIFITCYILRRELKLSEKLAEKLEDIDHNLRYFAKNTVRQVLQNILYTLLGLSFTGLMVYLIATHLFDLSYNIKLITSLEPFKLMNTLYPEFSFGVFELIDSIINGFSDLKAFILEKYNYFMSNR